MAIRLTKIQGAPTSFPAIFYPLTMYRVIRSPRRQKSVSAWPGARRGFPQELYQEAYQRIALQDELTRQFGRRAEQFAFKAKGSGKSGLISVSRCSQEVLERTACRIDPKSGDIVLRMEIGFPANGRTINARELEKILFDFVPECVKHALFYKNMDANRLRGIVDLAEDQHYIREMLPKMGLCAFVANGSVLPRESGHLTATDERRSEVPVPERTGSDDGTSA